MKRGIYLLMSLFIIGIIPSYGQLSDDFFKELLVALAPRPTPTAEIAAALDQADKCYREGFVGPPMISICNTTTTLLLSNIAPTKLR